MLHEWSIKEQKLPLHDWVCIFLSAAKGDISNMFNILYGVWNSLTYRYSCSLPACIRIDYPKLVKQLFWLKRQIILEHSDSPKSQANDGKWPFKTLINRKGGWAKRGTIRITQWTFKEYRPLAPVIMNLHM